MGRAGIHWSGKKLLPEIHSNKRAYRPRTPSPAGVKALTISANKLRWPPLCSTLHLATAAAKFDAPAREYREVPANRYVRPPPPLEG
jgi:hypothetical protein